MVGRDAIEPGSELAFTFEGAEFGDDLHEHLLSDLFGILRLEDHADGNVVDPCLVPQDQLLQRGPVAVLGLLDQLGIRGIVGSDLGERIEHGSAPLSASRIILNTGSNVLHTWTRLRGECDSP